MMPAAASNKRNASSIAGLSFHDVSKHFGKNKALSNLSFSIPPGATCAFIGANGAGKTTSFALVGGFLRRFSGKISLEFSGYGEVSLRTFRAAAGVIGLMPQDVICFEDRTIFSQLMLFSRLAGRSDRAAVKEVEELLMATDLSEHRYKLPMELSHGMRIRFGIAQAFIGNPAIVMLDEPTAGLDPLHLVQIRELLVKFKGRTTLVVSSHDLSELQGWCDYVVMIERGSCIKQGSLSEIVAPEADHSIWHLSGSWDLAALARAFPTLKFTSTERQTLNVANVSSNDQVVELVKWFDSQRCEVLSFDRRSSLEQAYLARLTQK